MEAPGENTKQKALNKPTTTEPGDRIHTLDEVLCLQISDSTYHNGPRHFNNLFQQFKPSEMTKNEMLFLLVYLVGIECGFCEYSSYECCSQQLRQKTMYLFDANNAYCISKYKPKYKCHASGIIFTMQLQNILPPKSLFSFEMSAVVSGEDMIITITPLQGGSRLVGELRPSEILMMSRYIVGEPRQPMQHSLKNLRGLAALLRDKVFLPLQQYYLPFEDLGTTFPALTGLADDQYDDIFHCLSPNQLRILANVNQRLNQLVQNSKHYKRKALKSSGVEKSKKYRTAY